MCYQFSKLSVERMKGVHPDLITIFSETIKNSPIDFGIPESGGIRSAGQQNILFQQGVTKCDGIQDKSKHQTGEALDVFAYVNGKASWNKSHLCMIAGIVLATAKRLKKEGKVQSEINWGGTFGSDKFQGWDLPHFEIV